MPKYTEPPTSYASSTLVRSSDWNKYFGSRGNINWAYDELQNISSGRFVMLKNAVLPVALGTNVLYQFGNYAEAYGQLDYANTITGTIQTPLHTGYVWVSACLNHTIGSAIVNTYTPDLNISIIDVTDVYTSSGGTSSQMYTSNGFTNTGGTPTYLSGYGISSLTRALSISCVIPVSNGSRRFRVGVFRGDNSVSASQITITHFTVLPLGDVSGLANFINDVKEIVE